MTARHPDWERWYSQPQEPGGNLGPDAKAKKVQEKRKLQEMDAHRYPIGGLIQSLVVLDEDGTSLMSVGIAPGMPAAVTFLQMLFALGGWNAVPLEPSPNDVQVSWFGFDIRDIMQIIALEGMRYNSTVAAPTAKAEVPAGLWYYRNFTPAPYLDPYETLVPSTLRGSIDLPALCEYLGVLMPPDLTTSAFSRAELARRLCLRGQLFPTETKW